MDATLALDPPLGVGDPPPVARRGGRRRHQHHRGKGFGFHGLVVFTGVSSVGDGLISVALPLLAVSLTSSALRIALLLVALRLPWLLAPAFGALTVRGNRRRTAIGIAIAQSALVIGMGVIVSSGLHHLAYLYALTFGIGCLEVAFATSTAKLTPDVVRSDDVDVAIGRLDAVRLTGDAFVGAAVGAPLFVVAAAAPFYLDGASFAVCLVILAVIMPVQAARTRHRIRRMEPAPLARRRRSSPSRALRRNIADAARSLRGRAALRLLVMALASLAFFEAMVFAILVLFALGPLHVSRSWFGVFIAAGAVGAAAGMLPERMERNRSHAASLVLGTAGAGVAYLLLAPAPSVYMAAGALILHGFAASVATGAARSLREDLIPASMSERMNSAFRTIIFASVPIGAVAGGLVAEAWSLRGAVLTAGLGQIIVVILLAGPILRRLSQPVIDLRGRERAVADTIDLRDPVPSAGS